MSSKYLILRSILLFICLINVECLYDGQIVKFQNLATGRMLEGNDRAAVYTNGWNDGNWQRWRAMVRDDTWMFRNLGNGMVLDSGPDGKVYLHLENGGS
jgi:hypothetical protein